VHYRAARSPQHDVFMRTPVVELKGLEKTFRTSKDVVRAVRRIDLTIHTGEVVALLGPNGAGKSTTIDMLLGLTQPDAGTVRVFGGTPHAAVAAGSIGVLLQTGSLIHDLSVRELLAMVAAVYPDPLDVDEVVELVGIEGIGDRRTQKLSGGETQRARFALALLPNPDLLVLDEPTVALDVEARHAFWATMRSFAAIGKTVVFATHNLDEADAFGDRAVMLSGGRVVADGSTTDLKAAVGLRTIRATLAEADEGALEILPGVEKVDRLGSTVTLHCTDADSTLRALLDRFPAARAIEVTSAGLEQAFLELVVSNGSGPVKAEVPR
jgi:ABC-2 type transport system ATP-binding protein